MRTSAASRQPRRQQRAVLVVFAVQAVYLMNEMA